MVYSAIGTTCFRLYWPSSGFYNIKEESIKAVKNCEGVLIKRSLHQSPDHFEAGSGYSQTQPQSLCSPKENTPISTPPSEFSLFINFSMFTDSSCTRNRVVRGLMYRSLNQHPLTVFYSFYRLFSNIVET